MNLLLNTHTFLWYFQDNDKLSSKAVEILEDTSNDLFLRMLAK